jgi:hypothetical protein
MIELVLIPLILVIFVPGVAVGVILARKLREWRK